MQEKALPDTQFKNGVHSSTRSAGGLVELTGARVVKSLGAAMRDTDEIIRGKNELERIERNIHTLVAVRRRRGPADGRPALGIIHV